MKLLVLADLHLDEVSDGDVLTRLGDAIQGAGAQADALIIAGDLIEAAVRNWPSAIRWLGRHYPAARTVFVPGNHDYYGGNLDTLDGELDGICRAEGASFGQCRSLVLGDTRILMATLWTDFQLYAEHGHDPFENTLMGAVSMPDYVPGVIAAGNPERALHPEDTIAVHEQHKAWGGARFSETVRRAIS